MAFNLCNSINLSLENVSDKGSITKVGERLNIETLLKRAEMGVVDLQAYQRSRNNDLRDQDVTREAVEALMDRPSSVMDRTFGFSREDGASELNVLRDVANRNRIEQNNDPEPAPEPAPAPAPATA